MRYSYDIKIDKPLDEVIRKFQDPDGLKYWMEGFDHVDHISGEPGTEGAVSIFHFKHKNREMQIEETILEQNLPHQIKFAYKSTMGYNEVEMVFEEESSDSVKLTSNNFFDLKGFMKIFGWLMPGTFKKQSMKYMTAFKEYVEKN